VGEAILGKQFNHGKCLVFYDPTNMSLFIGGYCLKFSSCKIEQLNQQWPQMVL